jgi:UDP-2,4-diacetamido-2,4,6-trideoxy-beta-L-altropyranose hydrolase
MRCLSLASEISNCGGQCLFICREHEGHIIPFIESQGHQVAVLPLDDKSDKSGLESVSYLWLGASWQDDAMQTRQCLQGRKLDWLVVDHYCLDERWQKSLRSAARKLMVVDDLADRNHDCDILLDQNLGRLNDDYSDKAPMQSETLIGPKYALLRPEFAEWREHSLKRRKSPQLKSLLITMGGVDKSNFTEKVLLACSRCELDFNLSITVVMGSSAPWLAQVQEVAANMPWPTEVKVSVNNMAELMAESDFAIGAAGATSWERCTLGLPSLLMVIADNQRDVASALEKAGAAILADSNNLDAQVRKIFSGDVKNRLKSMIDLSAAVADGRGVARVVNRMMNYDV